MCSPVVVAAGAWEGGGAHLHRRGWVTVTDALCKGVCCSQMQATVSNGVHIKQLKVQSPQSFLGFHATAFCNRIFSVRSSYW